MVNYGLTGVRPRVVIVGGGFGGVNAAKALKHARVDVLLIDRINHYLFQPLLYEVATGTLTPGDIAAPIRAMFRRQQNVTVLMGEVTGVNPAAKTLTVAAMNEPIAFDYLVLATGARDNFFNHPEWQGSARSLKSLRDAIDLREQILKSFELAELADDDASADWLTTFVIVGGGPTGVELAGTLAEMFEFTFKNNFRRLHPDEARILLVEAGPRILPAFDPALAQQVHRKLENMGVEMRVNSPVEAIDDQGAIIKGERVLSRNVIWAAGVRASPASDWLGVPADRSGRVIVNPDLSIPGHPDIFVVGDTAHTPQGDKPLPGVAQVAIQGGRHVGAVIKAHVERYPAPPPFVYHDKGSMATVSRWYAALELGNVKTAGLIGKLGWAFIHILYLSDMQNRIRTFIQWTWANLFSARGSRYITRPFTRGELASVDTPPPTANDG
ncbi:MAG: NAD(P)/FAD-dependent oxidoreductase [Anaerolineae bacterium]|nr:NAD(P)/FAD-dependent oxidoreductase [Anaerolineae bacterium]